MGYIGFRLGLSSEFVKLAGLIGGFFVSFRFYQGWGDALANRTPFTIEWAGAFVMVALVVGLYLGLTRCLRLLEKLVQVTFSAKLNKTGGLLAGFLRAALVTSVILVALRQLPSAYLSASIEHHSLSGPTLFRVAPAVYDTVFPMAGRFIASLRGASAR